MSLKIPWWGKLTKPVNLSVIIAPPPTVSYAHIGIRHDFWLGIKTWDWWYWEVKIQRSCPWLISIIVANQQATQKKGLEISEFGPYWEVTIVTKFIAVVKAPKAKLGLQCLLSSSFRRVRMGWRSWLVTDFSSPASSGPAYGSSQRSQLTLLWLSVLLL